MNINAAFILNVFNKVNIKDKYKQIFVTDYALSMFQTAFIAKSVLPQQNYEVLEFLGDSASNHAVVAYFYNVYPQLRCLSGSGVATLSRLKIKHTSSESFAKFATHLGFLQYIKATKEELDNPEKTQHLLEDVFEAFIGAMYDILMKHFGLHGVCNQIIYDFISYIFNQQQISFDLDELYDAKTRLKELFDNKSDMNAFYKTFGKPIYERRTGDGAAFGYDTKGVVMYTFLYFENNPNIHFIGLGASQANRDKSAAQQAIDWFKSQGYKTDKQFAPFCA
jgi:dsRNA-specific ribonuclease